jgi:hypothetical protein
MKFPEGTLVFHTNLQLVGIVVKPVGLGIDPNSSTLVDFEDGETREVSDHFLIIARDNNVG